MTEISRAPESIYQGGDLISPTDVDYSMYENILRASPGLDSEDARQQIMSTYILSKVAHAEQLRKSGEPYFQHPKAVSLISILEFKERDPNLISGCLLHDVPEDTIVGVGHLSFLVNKESANIAQLLNNPNKKGDETCIESRKKIHFNNIAEDELAIKGKTTDRTHNLRTILGPNIPLKKAEEKLDETDKYVLPLIKRLGDSNERILYTDVLEIEMEKVFLAVQRAKQ